MSESTRAPRSRRAFLKASGAAALGGLGLAPATAVAQRKFRGGFGGFNVGAQSYTFRNFKLDEALRRMQDLGLAYVEFYHGHVPVESTRQQLKAVLTLCSEHGITPIGFGVEPFTRDMEANRKRFELGKALGIKYLSADPTPDSFDVLDKLVEEYQIAIAIHPHGPQGKQLHRWSSAEVILAAVKDHHPLIGTCIDTGHLIRSAQPPFFKQLDPAQQIGVMGARNFAIHLKDHDNQRRTDVVFGKGVLDVPGVLRALKAVKFQGGLNIEYEAHPEDPSPDTRACLTVLKDAIGQLG